MTTIVLLVLLNVMNTTNTTESENNISTANNALDLSTQLLESVRHDRPYEAIQNQLATFDLKALSKQLDTDTKKKAFWINIYNANIQLLLSNNPALFEDRGNFFSTPRTTIANKKLSFDDIEHGIIRGSQSKLALGFLPKWFVSSYEKKLRVSERDGRIHFALNCGAKSCPPVAIYEADQLDKQLDESSRRYLNATTTYEASENKVYVTALFSWFRGDFGGLSGAKEDYLKKYKVIPQDSDPSLSFKDYDWTLDLGHYIDL